MHYMPEDKFVASIGFTKLDNKIVDMMPDIGVYAWAVYSQLARHADRQGHCWPGIRRLARLTGIGKDTIVKCVKHLQKLGLIDFQKRGDKSTEYWVIPPKECAITSYTRVRSHRTEQEPLEQEEDAP